MEIIKSTEEIKSIEDFKEDFNGKTYIPLNIAKKAIKEAYQNSKEYKKTMDKLEDLNLQFKDAMKELGEGFNELGKIKF